MNDATSISFADKQRKEGYAESIVDLDEVIEHIDPRLPSSTEEPPRWTNTGHANLEYQHRLDLLSSALDKCMLDNAAPVHVPLRFNTTNDGDTLPDHENEEDEEDENESPLLSEQDPLYEPSLDEENQTWVQKHFEQTQDLISDAVLSCPGCFTIVCFASQRHVKYNTQYRAMDVVHCMTAEDDTLAILESMKDVMCSECTTQVGLWDPQERVYHLFNVLPSHA